MKATTPRLRLRPEDGTVQRTTPWLQLRRGYFIRGGTVNNEECRLPPGYGLTSEEKLQIAKERHGKEFKTHIPSPRVVKRSLYLKRLEVKYNKFP